MNIKIATYYNAPNMGAFMQAYALNNFLINEGNEVSFIECDMSAEWEKLKNPYFVQLKKVINAETETYFKTCSFDAPADLQIIGSDEVWNLSNYFARHNKPFWSGENVNKIIAYAPCAAGTDKKKVHHWLAKIPMLLKMDALSARDRESYKVIKLMAPFKKIVKVLDPTFLIDYTDIKNGPIKERYLLIYTYGINEEIKNILIKYAREHDLMIVVSGCYAPWADYNAVVDHTEWLGLFKYAEKVFTSTFHGTVFSIIFRKNFVTYCNGGKAKEICKEFSLDRYTNNAKAFLSMLDTPIIYENIEKTINEKTAKSKDYLKSYL